MINEHDENEFMVDVDRLLCHQSYVKRTVVEAKKLISHLRTKYRDD